MNSYHKASGRRLKGWYGADATLQRFYVDDEAEPMLELYPCFVDVVGGEIKLQHFGVSYCADLVDSPRSIVSEGRCVQV